MSRKYKPAHRLPDGTTTKSDAKYVKAWRTLGARLEAITGYKSLGFDPGFLMARDNGSSVDIPMDLALKLIALDDARLTMPAEVVVTRGSFGPPRFKVAW